MKKIFFITLYLTVIAAFVGCGVSKGTLKDAEKRINALKERGMPDSSLSRAIVFLYQSKDAKERGNFGLAKKSADSLLVLIAKAEEKYDEDLTRLRPYLENMKKKFKAVKSEVSGLPEKRLDSIVAVVDSFMSINWLLQAEAKANMLDSIIPRIKFDEQRGKEIRPRIIGQWVCTNTTKHSEDKSVNAVEKKIFTFGSDGKATFVEKKKGKSTPYFKEDWEFISWGDWDLMGDTIFVMVDRFKSVRQDFEEKHIEDGKERWEKKRQPTYDSTITDGSQDRYITFEDLKKDFVKQ